MFDFDIILRMDCLHACFGFLDIRMRVVKFQFPNEPIRDCKGRNIYDKGSNHFLLEGL